MTKVLEAYTCNKTGDVIYPIKQIGIDTYIGFYFDPDMIPVHVGVNLTKLTRSPDNDLMPVSMLKNAWAHNRVAK